MGVVGGPTEHGKEHCKAHDHNWLGINIGRGNCSTHVFQCKYGE